MILEVLYVWELGCQVPYIKNDRCDCDLFLDEYGSKIGKWVELMLS